MRSRPFVTIAGVAVVFAVLLGGCQRQPQQGASQVPAPTRGIFGSAPSMMPNISYDVTSGLISVDSGAPVYLTVLAVEPRTGQLSVVFPPPGREKLLSNDLAIQLDLSDEAPVASIGGSELDAINRGRCANPSRAPSGGIPSCVPGPSNAVQPMAPARSILVIATSEPIVVPNDSANPAKGRGIRRFLPDQWAGAWLRTASTSGGRVVPTPIGRR